MDNTSTTRPRDERYRTHEGALPVGAGARIAGSREPARSRLVNACGAAGSDCPRAARQPTSGGCRVGRQQWFAVPACMQDRSRRDRLPQRRRDPVDHCQLQRDLHRTIEARVARSILVFARACADAARPPLQRGNVKEPLPGTTQCGISALQFDSQCRSPTACNLQSPWPWALPRSGKRLGDSLVSRIQLDTGSSGEFLLPPSILETDNRKQST